MVQLSWQYSLFKKLKIAGYCQKTDSSLSTHWLPIAHCLETGIEKFPPCTLVYHLLSLCKSCLGDYINEMTWVQLPYHVYKTLSHSSIPVFWLLQSFCFFFHDCFLSLSGRGQMVDLPSGVWHPKVTCLYILTSCESYFKTHMYGGGINWVMPHKVIILLTRAID